MGIDQSAHVPSPGKTVTPGQTIGQNINTDSYWKNKALEARAMREYEEEKRNIEAMRNPITPEPPVKMTGSINLGNIDFQEQARRAQEAVELSRQDAEARANKLEEENTKLKNDLLATTINNLQNTLGNQIQKLQADLAAGRGTSKSVAEQLKEVIDSASLLGFVKPEAVKPGPVVQQATDSTLSLEMLRLQLEDKKSDRQFAWQMEKDRRQFQLELKKLDQANRLAAAQLQAQKDSSAWISKFPELLGGAISHGLSAKAHDMNSISTAAPRPRPMPPKQPVQQPVQPNNIENNGYEPNAPRKVLAGPGEAGSIDCPECGSSIAIGPTATKAVCAGCEYTVDVIRDGNENGD
ncbi:MAG: hypothetical protein PHC43_00145 [Candidatus Marinimicrobia bacterium]|jgi:exosome complex RNA-binding protein Csl4|nr:hypothetical protein [Candidatus Neomarinimicrobiota bacterium]